MLVITGRLLDKSGGSAFKVFFWIVLLLLIGYAGHKLVPPFFSYQMMKYEVRSEAKVANLYTNDEIKSRLMKKAASWNVPIEWHDIKVERRLRRIDISFEYDVTVEFYQDYKRTFHYNISARAPLKER